MAALPLGRQIYAATRQEKGLSAEGARANALIPAKEASITRVTGRQAIVNWLTRIVLALSLLQLLQLVVRYLGSTIWPHIPTVDCHLSPYSPFLLSLRIQTRSIAKCTSANYKYTGPIGRLHSGETLTPDIDATT